MTSDDPRRPHDQGHEPPTPRGPDPSRWDVDEIASALLDGALTPDQATAARARADVMARAAAMDAARGAVRSVPPADPQAREHTIAAALAAFDADSPGAAADGRAAVPAGGPPSDLAAHRRAYGGGRGRRSATPRWLAAAAAAAVLAGVAGLIAVGDRGGDQDSASQTAGGSAAEHQSEATDSSPGDGAADAPSAESGDAESSGGGDGDASALEPGGERSTTAEAGDLGSFASEDDLAERIAAVIPTDADSGTDAGAQPGAPRPDAAEQAVATCSPADLPPPLDDPDTPLRLHGRARLDGEPVDVWVADAVDGPRLVAVDADCGVVVDRPLA